MGKNRGVDAVSNIAQGGSNISADLDAARSAAPLNIFTRAVVVEILSDISSFSVDKFSEIEGTIKNAKFLKNAPRNSLIVREVTAAADKQSASGMLCYPFFPPHMCFPVKQGEQVWLLFENPETNPELGYWMCRVPEHDFVDDVNYTHGDRRFELEDGDKSTSEKANAAEGQSTSEKADKKTADKQPEGPPFIPSFPNGDPDDESAGSLSGEKPYEEIFTNSVAGKSFVAEPVPRYTKRPGDLVLQGSNNTLISLGQDRGYTKDTRPDPLKSNASVLLADGENANEEDKIPSFSGTIDIVVGRGRFYEEPNPEVDPEDTQPRVITNSREVIETDKNPAANSKGSGEDNRLIDAPEGDPDLLRDASRIYVSMKTHGDKNFSLEYPNIPVVSDAENVGEEAKPVPENEGDEGKPYIVLKSDEIRIIARRDEEKEINGSIKIVKEGDPDDEEGKGRAVIMIQPDGTIMIDGPKVVIGSGIEKGNGEGNQVALGLGATEPVVLGEILKQKMEAYMDAVTAAFLYASTHIHPTGTGPSGPPTGEQWSANKSKIDSTKGELQEILSKLAKTL